MPPGGHEARDVGTLEREHHTTVPVTQHTVTGGVTGVE